ncbi:hypothetical protein RhiirA1_465442 [Rhizophagus irregularis]|uniref:Uncharacterized protein n=1 Tax=Rhizophagus irregularis TaxID=588596 RepID=A0A2I1EUF0_9GLOM|nr:hypothetical protein RhiirA1_465442 [Rhizophagus irregularis]PKY25732.1 hypothetical protein RhiirB3_440796 [Rhizophagus irregularis]
MSLSSAWRSVVRIVKKVQDKAHNYPKLPAFPLVEKHLPFQIGWNVSKKNYNTFFERNESTKLKFHLENRNVFIIAMPLPVHIAVVSMLQDFFKIPNSGVIRDPPITVLGAPSHYDPSDNTYTLKTYADVTVSPYIAHLTVPINLRHPGPPLKNPHRRIFCEVAYTELNFLHKKCTNWMLEGYVRQLFNFHL